MGTDEKKGFLTGSMKFTTSDDADAVPEAKGPLLPLRILVVTDLVPGDDHNAGASAPEGAVRVEPKQFDELFERIRPRLAIDVPSVLADGRNVRVDLSPTELKALRPDGLCADVPLLRSLVDGRLVLDRLRDGGLTEDGAKHELDRLWKGSAFAREVLGLIGRPAERAPAASGGGTPAPSGPGTPSIDSILGMVQLEGGELDGAPPAAPVPQPRAEAPVSRFSELIAAVARSARPGGGSGPVRPAEAIARVERAIGVQLGAILQHPEVRRLERAYRALRFLTERATKIEGVVFDVVSARAKDAAAAFERALRSKTPGPPVSFAVVDVEIDGSAASLAALEAIANVAEAYAVPAVVNGTTKLVGQDDLAGVERLDHKAGWMEAPHQAPWRAAAAKPAMRWLSVALNGAMLRTAYDKSTSRVREATVVELPNDDGAIVWLAPAYLVAALVVGSFGATGWPSRITGPKTGGVVHDLPVRELSVSHEGDTPIAVPTEAFLSTDSQRDLAKTGILALAAAPNSDAVYVLTAPTAYVPPPKRTYDSATTEPEVRFDRVSLGDQLFVARIAQFLRALCSKLPADGDPAELEPIVSGALGELFENAPPSGPEITVKAKKTDDGAAVEVVVRPRRYLGVSIEEIGMEFPLG